MESNTNVSCLPNNKVCKRDGAVLYYKTGEARSLPPGFLPRDCRCNLSRWLIRWIFDFTISAHAISSYISKFIREQSLNSLSLSYFSFSLLDSRSHWKLFSKTSGTLFAIIYLRVHLYTYNNINIILPPVFCTVCSVYMYTGRLQKDFFKNSKKKHLN